MANTATSVVQQRNSDMVELLKPDFVTRSELTYLTAVDQYMRLPCLRFLGLGGLGSGGEWRDVSGNGMHLSYNGNPVMGYTSQGAPWFAYDGAGDYHSHADDAHFDITGTETTVAAAIRGLTLCAWVYYNNAPSVAEEIISKYLTVGDQRSYRFARNTTGELIFLISSAGTGATTATASGGTPATATWTFVSAVYLPSTSMKITVNDSTTTLAAGVPASIFNGTGLVGVAALGGGGNNMTGCVAFPTVCACALSDALITRLYQSSRGLFGV